MEAHSQDSYFQVDILSRYHKNKYQEASVGLSDNVKSEVIRIMSVYDCASLISL
jgi:hypothetical protein